MPSLRFLLSHHEDWVKLHVPLPDWLEGLLKLPVATLLLQDQRLVVFATESNNLQGENTWRKISTRSPQSRKPTLIGANGGNPVRPTAPPVSPTEPSIGDWIEDRSRDGMVRLAAQPSYMPYEAALGRGTVKKGTEKTKPKGKLTLVAEGGGTTGGRGGGGEIRRRQTKRTKSW